jgi:hypothetical protein
MFFDQRYWIEPWDDRKFLAEVFKYFQGGALVLLEGDLEYFHFQDILGFTTRISEPFAPQASDAKEKIVLPLEQSTYEQILERILPSNRFKKAIDAMQIVKEGDIRFMTGDNFHHECISMHAETPKDFLESLRLRFIIKRFYLLERSAR